MNKTARRFGVVWFSQEKENTCFSATQIRGNKILIPSLMLNILKWKDVGMRVCVGMRVSIHVVVLTRDFWVNNKKRLIIVQLIYVDTGRCCWLLRVCEVFALGRFGTLNGINEGPKVREWEKKRWHLFIHSSPWNMNEVTMLLYTSPLPALTSIPANNNTKHSLWFQGSSRYAIWGSRESARPAATDEPW